MASGSWSWLSLPSTTRRVGRLCRCHRRPHGIGCLSGSSSPARSGTGNLTRPTPRQSRHVVQDLIVRRRMRLVTAPTCSVAACSPGGGLRTSHDVHVQHVLLCVPPMPPALQATFRGGRNTNAHSAFLFMGHLMAVSVSPCSASRPSCSRSGRRMPMARLGQTTPVHRASRAMPRRRRVANLVRKKEKYTGCAVFGHVWPRVRMVHLCRLAHKSHSANASLVPCPFPSYPNYPRHVLRTPGSPGSVSLAHPLFLLVWAARAWGGAGAPSRLWRKDCRYQWRLTDEGGERATSRTSPRAGAAERMPE